MNKHKLEDWGVQFDATTHTYTYEGRQLQGITSTLVDYIFPNTYNGIPQEVLDKAAEHGSYVHSCIEMADIVGATEGCPESETYLQMMRDHNVECIAHEYLVTDGLNFASAIDLVLQDNDNNIVLGDIKTTSALYEPKVTLQLNIYRYFFEMCNTGLKVDKLVEVWLPKAQYGAPRWVELPMVDTSVIEGIIESYLAGESNEKWVQYFDVPAPVDMTTIPTELVAQINALVEFERQAKVIKEQQEIIKAELLKAMRDNHVTSWETDNMKISYVKPSKRKALDTARLKDEYPAAYADCQKETITSDSVRIKLK